MLRTGGASAATIFCAGCLRRIRSLLRAVDRVFSAEAAWLLLGFEGVSREQAAQEILSREVRFQYRPIIVEVVAKRDR